MADNDANTHGTYGMGSHMAMARISVARRLRLARVVRQEGTEEEQKEEAPLSAYR